MMILLRRALGISTLLAALALAAPRAHAQQAATLLSPDLATITGQQPESMIESAAAIGRITLAVWGATVPETPSPTFRTVLWSVLLRGTAVAGAPVRLHGDAARPYGVVCVLNLRDRFLVLWNDRRSDTSIMSRLVDTTGRPVGPERRFANGALASADHVWLNHDTNGYRIVWSTKADTAERFQWTHLDEQGAAVGAAVEVPTANFDDDLTFTELPGAHILRDTVGPSRFVHADGHVDPRPVVTAFLAKPHYLNPDTSILVVETDGAGRMSIATHPSIFDTATGTRVPFVIPGLKPPTPFDTLRFSIAGLCRDSTGRPRILVDGMVLNRPLGQSPGGWLYRWTVRPDGTLYDSTWLVQTFYWLNYDAGKSILTGTLLGNRPTTGDNNAVHLRYDWLQNSFSRTLGSRSDSEHAEFRVDRFGNVYDTDPLVAEATGRNDRASVPVRRRELDDSSSIRITPVPGVVVNVSVPVIPKYRAVDRGTPALARFGDDFVVGWKSDVAEPTFGFSIWRPYANAVITLPTIAFTPPDVYTAVGESFAQGARLTQLGDRLVLSRREVLTVNSGGRFDTYTSYTLVEATVSGAWDTLLRRTSPPNQDLAGDLPCTLNPDSNAVHAGLIGARGELYSVRRTETGTDVAELPPHDADAILPFANGITIVAGKGWALRYHDNRLLDSVSLTANPVNDNAQYQRLRGDRFLRWFPLNPLRSNGLMSDSLARFELRNAAGELLAEADIVIGAERYDAFVWERAADRALFIASGDGRGVHLAVLDSTLRVRLADSVLEATDGIARNPVMSVRGDSIWFAWQKYRPEYNGIYGTIAPLPEATRAGAGIGHTAGPVAFVVRNAGPNPANDHITLEIESTDDIAPRIGVYDALGRRTATGQARQLGGGLWRAMIDVRGLPTGAYAVEATDAGGGRGATRVIVMH